MHRMRARSILSDGAASFTPFRLAAGAFALTLALSGCAPGPLQPYAPPPVSPSSRSASPSASNVRPSASEASGHGQSFDALAVGITAGSPATFTKLLDVGSMKVGVYRVQAGAADPQDSHVYDEIYVVLDGSAQLHTADMDVPVTDGSIVFVRGGVAHDFEQVERSLTLVVLFAKAAGGSDEPPVLTADATSLAKDPSPSANLFRRFLKVPSLTGGAYLLPLKHGGDRSQTHPVDELNVVISGTGVLSVGSDEEPYGPGSLIYVPAHVGHAFHDLGSDSLVLIFWPANP